MNNEMKFEKNGLLIPNDALEELGLAGISLSAWLGQDHILLMPQEMTAEQLLHALEGLSRASVELLGVLQKACRMPCAEPLRSDTICPVVSICASSQTAALPITMISIRFGMPKRGCV